MQKPFQLKKGDKFALRGQIIEVAKNTSIKAKTKAITTANTKPKEVKGESSSDSQREVLKSEVMQLIGEQIDKLEAHENYLLQSESFRDDELEDDHSFDTVATTAAFATNAVVISELHTLLNKIQKL